MPRFRTHPPQSCIVSKPHPEYEFRARFSVSHIQCGACELGPSIGAKEPTVLRYVCATGRCRRTSFFCSLPKKLPRQWFSQHLLSPSRELMFRMKRPTTSAWAPNHTCNGVAKIQKTISLGAQVLLVGRLIRSMGWPLGDRKCCQTSNVGSFLNSGYRNTILRQLPMSLQD